MHKITMTVLALATASACATPTDPGVDLGGGAITREDGRLSITRQGGRVPAAIVGVTRIGRSLWIGTRAVSDVSRPEEPMRGELVRLDLDSGQARVFEDELPRVTPDWDGEQPVWTAGAVELGGRTYLASQQGLVIVDGDQVSLRRVDLGAGRLLHGNVIAADARRERVWLGGDEGLAALAADGTVVAYLDPAALGGEHVVSLSVAPATGLVHAVVHGEDGSTRAVRVAGDRVVSSWMPADGGQVWSVVAAARLGGALIAVRSFDPATGGVFLWHGGEGAERLVSEGQLAEAARGRAAPFGTSVMTYDEDSDLLIVGGQLRPAGIFGSIVGGGLVWIDLSGAAPRLSGLSTATSALRGDHVSALAWDPVRRRTYAALRAACDELKLASLGLETITFEDGGPRFERPLLSGVRDIAVDGKQVQLALRDSSPGFMCSNVAVQEGLVELRGDGSGWVVDHRDPATPSFHPNREAPAVLATELGGRLVASASPDWGLFAGGGEGTLTNPFADLHLGKHLHDVAFDGPGVVWLAGAAEHHSFDTPEMADRGQRGMARLEIDEHGTITAARRYVARVTDREPGEIVTGLPSSDVRAVLPTGDGGAYVVCGRERYTDLPWEHADGPPFETRDGQRPGGVALIDRKGNVTVLAGGDVVPDGRAGALGPDGTLHVLDAERGLLVWDGRGFVREELPAEIPEGSVPTALWVGRDGDLAASFTTGLAVRLGGQAAFAGGYGAAWRAAERAPGVLLVGTDEGLLRVRAPGAADVVETPPPAGELPPFRR